MSDHKNQPFTRRLGFALAGLTAACKGEPSLRVQLVIFVAALLAMLALRLEPVWWALVLLTGSAVIAAELFNTALEHLADHVHPDIHPRIRIVKDCAAAAVLVAACGALAVGIALLIHVLRRG